jgi:histone H3/H4
MAMLTEEKQREIKSAMDKIHKDNAERIVAKLDKEFQLSADAKEAVKKEVEDVQMLAYIQTSLLLITTGEN